MRRLFPLFATVLVLLAGCATKRIGGGMVSPFQSMVREGDLLITVDAAKEADLALSLLGNEQLAKRCGRINVALTDNTYPLDSSTSRYSVVVEGDYPGFLVNIALSSTKRFEKADGYWQADGQHIGSVSSKGFLLTDKDFQEEKARVMDGPIRIDDVLAERMASHGIAMYAIMPKTFVSVDGITKGMLSSISSVLILGDKDQQGKRWISASFVMSDEKKAETLSKMMKSAYMADLRKENRPYDLEELKSMFTLEGNMLTIEKMEIGEEKWSSIVGSLSFSV